jgi:hypothetical protein
MRIFLFILCSLCQLALWGQVSTQTLSSPDKKLTIHFGLKTGGIPYYDAFYQDQAIITDSKLGLVCRGVDYSKNMAIISSSNSTKDETWTPVWGEEDKIRDHHNALKCLLETKDGQRINIHFKAFDNGFGFRYELLGSGSVTVLDEVTEFSLTADHTTWWAPLDWDSNEHTYTEGTISTIDATKYVKDIEPFNQYIPYIYGVQTPVTMKMANGVHIAIAEAGLHDYGAMSLTLDRKALRFKSFIVPTADSTVKSVNKLPFNTPWRAVLISPDAAGIITNRIILNLNEPNKIEGDLSWIKPQKYVGIWWEMHVGRGSWDYMGGQDSIPVAQRKPHGKHSANTANVKKYIDFAAKYGFSGVLVEGWNDGWEEWFNKMKPEVFDFTKPYPDFNMDELAAYGKAKGVKIIMHHETSSAVPSYERQMDAAYAYMRKHSIEMAKTGYVGYIQPKGEWHDGQRMVNHYEEVARRMAKNKLMVDMHEPVRPSGTHRTWPNYMSSEAGRGMEYNAWSKGNAPSHVITLPFTRVLGGPMDYTPGIFETRMNTYDKNKKEIIQSTVANQMALYVTMYSPIQMAADLPENYEKRLDVFQFIRDVPVDWSETKVLNAEVGNYLTIARREKGKNNWFIGSITDETPRVLKSKLDFLEAGKTYEATFYADGKTAHYKTNPYPVVIYKRKVKKGDKLMLRLAAGGGCAISIVEQKK